MTSQTHLSYEVSKKLKEFLGEDTPEPIEAGYWCGNGHAYSLTPPVKKGAVNSAPFYKLHDLLSRPFCEAMAKKIRYQCAGAVYSEMAHNNWLGGLPAVEKVLLDMMEAK